MAAVWIDASALDNADTDDHDTASIRELLEHLAVPAWQADALCREYPAEWWFPSQGDSTERAKIVCSGCLVRDECESYAFDQGDQLAGIWAGMGHKRRREIRRNRDELGIDAAQSISAPQRRQVIA